ncbi:hypothetical protein PF008_g21097 [Phytophthora fragariae]|uniref:Uncharacterized protein n=1 Tax=Phytophthora fragariae TaxID=53985 RepID=A0A6G0QYM1_9STRA|nr:hypothetical protein PF008_g21097 [Phytophthora fragariae]
MDAVLLASSLSDGRRKLRILENTSLGTVVHGWEAIASQSRRSYSRQRRIRSYSEHLVQQIGSRHSLHFVSRSDRGPHLKFVNGVPYSSTGLVGVYLEDALDDAWHFTSHSDSDTREYVVEPLAGSLPLRPPCDQVQTFSFSRSKVIHDAFVGKDVPRALFVHRLDSKLQHLQGVVDAKQAAVCCWVPLLQQAGR